MAASEPPAEIPSGARDLLLTPGTRLGHYKILEPIGAGGMGEVYRAHDEHLDRDIALKVLPPSSFADPTARARLLREARTASKLNHPHICTIHEVDEADGQAYIAMEYVEGRTLKQELAAGPLPLPRLLTTAAQIASALDHAHHRGILHRDIKSSNIVLTPEGQSKLLDFGLAKPVAAGEETVSEPTLTAPGHWVGTLHYAAPEVLSGQPAEPRSDLYSFGVVLYEMATGQLPYTGLEGSALIAAILRGEVPPARQRNPALPLALSQFFDRALAADPGQRFASARELLEALRTLAAAPGPQGLGEPAPALPVLAVLEFQNLAGDPAMDWLGTGMAETLTADLKKLNLLRVVGRDRIHEARRRLGREATAEEIGRALRARWVVTGSHQGAGDRLRITPQLLEVATGEILATGKVDGHWEELFGLQDRVVEALLAALQVEADSSARQRIAPPETRKLEAYEHYVQGRQHFHRLGKQSLEQARQRFERAVALDSRYALAYSGLGAAHAMRFIHRTDPEDLARGRAALERAVELDPELAEPYPWLCYIYARQGKLDQALQAGKKGVEREPDLAQAHYFWGAAEIVAIETDPASYPEAVRRMLKAGHLEPRWEPTWICLGELALLAGEYDRAEQFLGKAQELERTGTAIGRFVGAETILGSLWLRRGEWEKARQLYRQALELLAASDHMYRDAFAALSACGLGDIHLREGKAAEALAAYRRAWRTGTEFPRMLGHERVLIRTLSGLAAAYAAQGERQRAEQLTGEAAERLETATRQPHTWIWEASTARLCHSLAVAHLRLSNTEAALELLKKAVEKGWRDAHGLVNDPELATLRQRPRFSSLVETLERLPPLEFIPAP